MDGIQTTDDYSLTLLAAAVLDAFFALFGDAVVSVEVERRAGVLVSGGVAADADSGIKSWRRARSSSSASRASPRPRLSKKPRVSSCGRGLAATRPRSRNLDYAPSSPGTWP